MAFKDANSINFDKLEEELNAAVTADEKYWRENDAKFRAVEQKVATYEEFKDIVAASHLKPLDKGDKVTDVSQIQQPWNAHADKKKSSTETCTATINQDVLTSFPKNGHEFARDWRRYYKTTEEKYKYLMNIGAVRLGHIFKTEISFGLLGEFLNVLLHHEKDDTQNVIQILTALSGVSRFSLSLQFLGSSEKGDCMKLFQQLKQTLHDTGEDAAGEDATVVELSQLQKKYGVLD